jgi:hypothetical protein
MKYSLNHPYKFVHYGYGVFTCGLVRLIVIFFVEGCNLILLLNSDNVVDVVANFVALAVIADIDDVYYSANSSHPVIKWMNDYDDWKDLFVTERTSS